MLSVAEIRKLTGLSQTKFAKKYHITLSTLLKWEQGTNRTPEHYLYALNELIKYEGYFYNKENE